MRRALAILKYVPAVLCGLLVVAWVVSLRHGVEIRTHIPARAERINSVGIFRGSVTLDTIYGATGRTYVEFGSIGNQEITEQSGFGQFSYMFYAEWGDIFLRCPIPFIFTLIAPLSVSTFTHFRFPLWSYFAWTALVAAELAYYLR